LPRQDEAKSLRHGAGRDFPNVDNSSATYRADFDAMHAHIGYLTENYCGSNAAACAPGTVAGAEKERHEHQ
jgi:hypothetical protein